MYEGILSAQEQSGIELVGNREFLASLVKAPPGSNAPDFEGSIPRNVRILLDRDGPEDPLPDPLRTVEQVARLFRVR